MFSSDDARRDLDAGATPIAGCASARSTTRASTPIRRRRTRVYVLNVGFYRSTDGGKTFARIRVPHGDNHDLWIAPNDPKRMIKANDGGANVTVEWRRELDGAGLSDGAVLPRVHHESRAVSRVRRAAGQHARRACRARAADALVSGWRRRERLHRAPSDQPRPVLRRQLRRPADALRHRRPGTSRRSTSGPRIRWATPART